MKKIRVLVVDDHALFRAGLVSLLSQMPEFEVVGEAGDGRQALEGLPRTKPDVILLDVNMPRMNGIETVKALKDHPEIHVIMLTISKHDEDLFGAIEAGADGYLLKNAEPGELQRAINLVVEGSLCFLPKSREG